MDSYSVPGVSPVASVPLGCPAGDVSGISQDRALRSLVRSQIHRLPLGIVKARLSPKRLAGHSIDWRIANVELPWAIEPGLGHTEEMCAAFSSRVGAACEEAAAWAAARMLHACIPESGDKQENNVPRQGPFMAKATARTKPSTSTTVGNSLSELTGVEVLHISRGVEPALLKPRGSPSSMFPCRIGDFDASKAAHATTAILSSGQQPEALNRHRHRHSSIRMRPCSSLDLLEIGERIAGQVLLLARRATIHHFHLHSQSSICPKSNYPARAFLVASECFSVSAAHCHWVTRSCFKMIHQVFASPGAKARCFSAPFGTTKSCPDTKRAIETGSSTQALRIGSGSRTHAGAGAPRRAVLQSSVTCDKCGLMA